MSGKTPLKLYVNHPDAPQGAPCFDTITDALSAMDGLAPVEASVRKEMEAEKSYPAPDFDITPVILYIGEGTYRERIVVSRPKVSFVGASAKTRIVCGLGAFEMMEDGTKRGTFRTATLRVDAPDFTAENLTVENDAGFGHTVGQALALYVAADRCRFERCRLISSQDTLFTAPLPPAPSSPGGFRGPDEDRPRVMTRQYYRNCFIQGDVDFIFGSATAWFEGCTLFSKKPGDRLPGEAEEAQQTYGYVTAASTPKEYPYGYVFHNCKLESDCPPHSVYLGRPWREYAKTVFLHCELGEHIYPIGWADWNKPHELFYYGEYASFGPGANAGCRADFSHQLTEAEASLYTIQNVLDGWSAE